MESNDSKPQVTMTNSKLIEACAEKVVFVGAGAGGSRMSDAFHKLGYESFWVNTTDQDGKNLACRASVLLSEGKNAHGAGKDPSKGQIALQGSKSAVVDAMKKYWHEPDRVMICVGAGGGTGSGATLGLIDCARQFFDAERLEGDPNKKIGVIASLPKRSESPTVQGNALGLLEELFVMVQKNEITPLILIDNDEVDARFDKKIPVFGYWTKINDFFAGIYHSFNMLAGQSSELEVFDRSEYKNVLESGFVAFGHADIGKANTFSAESLVRVLQDTLLVNGVDFKTTKFAGALAVGDESIWSTIPRDDVDFAVSALAEFLEVPTVCLGLYLDENPNLRVQTIVGGMNRPDTRLNDLVKRSAHQSDEKSS